MKYFKIFHAASFEYVWRFKAESSFRDVVEFVPEVWDDGDFVCLQYYSCPFVDSGGLWLHRDADDFYPCCQYVHRRGIWFGIDPEKGTDAGGLFHDIPLEFVPFGSVVFCIVCVSNTDSQVL